MFCLPKYDFPINTLNVSPGSHRIQSIVPLSVGDEVRYVPAMDQSAVFMRPKEEIGSTGSVFASEDLKLIYESPAIYEVSGTGKKYSHHLGSICHIIRMKLRHLEISLKKDDVLKMQGLSECPYRVYEEERLKNLLYHLNLTISKYYSGKMDVSEMNTIKHLMELVQTLKNSIGKILDDVVSAKIKGTELWVGYEKVLESFQEAKEIIISLDLPPIKPNYHLNSDKGPGSGINNYEVLYRAVEIFFINNLDRFHRIHTVPQDSGYNLVERTNAAVGKAVVKNGGPIDWATHSLPSTGELKQLSPVEIQELEKGILQMNCWSVCQELADRCSGAPGPRNYMHSFVSQVKEDLFLWDGSYLNQFVKQMKSSKKACSDVPGANYYSWLMKQKELHSEHGEDSLELLKFACETEHNSRCEMCKEWVGNPLESRCPYPFPDANRPGKYCKLDETPTVNRKVDNYHPKVQAIIAQSE